MRASVMTSRRYRTGRGIGLGVIATLLALSAHALASGCLPSVPVIGLAFASSSLVGMALAGRRFSALRLALVACLAQIPFHLLFSINTHLVATSPAHHGQIRIQDLGPATEHGDMLELHAAAALLTVLYVLFGRVLVLAAIDRGQEWLRKTLALLGWFPPSKLRSRLPEGACLGASPHFFLQSINLRGPPLMSATQPN